MKYNKIVVLGCSVSSTTKVHYAWGHYLSARLGLDYLHFAQGCSSDKRNFRLLIQAIQSGEVDENSLVLFQPTEVTRRELPSHVTDEEYEKHMTDVMFSKEPGASAILDKTLTGSKVSFFKIDSHTWQPNNTDATVHKQYQERPGCLDSMFDAEMLSVYYYMLEQTCKQKNITLVTIWDGTRGWLDVLQPHLDVGAIFDHELWFQTMNYFTENERLNVYALSPPHDTVHFSEAGHIKLADDIHTFLEEKGVI
tara:strand:- start:466 stop:1221 length:756 start_codon:yes stop_codon:yes gene_type:complete